jgi:hypothetical protein
MAHVKLGTATVVWNIKENIRNFTMCMFYISSYLKNSKYAMQNFLFEWVLLYCNINASQWHPEHFFAATKANAFREQGYRNRKIMERMFSMLTVKGIYNRDQPKCYRPIKKGLLWTYEGLPKKDVDHNKGKPGTKMEANQGKIQTYYITSNYTALHWIQLHNMLCSSLESIDRYGFSSLDDYQYIQCLMDNVVNFLL